MKSFEMRLMKNYINKEKVKEFREKMKEKVPGLVIIKRCFYWKAL